MSACLIHTQTAAGVAQFAYPTSALLSFLALRSICLYNGQSSLPRIDPSYVRRNVLLGLVAIVISTYAASTINIFVRAITHSEGGIDKDKEYYLLYAAVVWAFELLFWPKDKEYAWYPYLVSASICVLGEVIILESTLTSSLAFGRFDLISFNMQCLRIAALLLLPAIYFGQKLSHRNDNRADEERQSLLGDSETSERSSNDGQPSQIKGYGSLGKGVAVRDYARSRSDRAKSSTDEIRSDSRNQRTTRHSGSSGSAAERILVSKNGEAVALGTPGDIVRIVSAESNIDSILAKKDIKAEAKKPRKPNPFMKSEATRKSEAARKSLVTVRETATSINGGKSRTGPGKRADTRSTTPPRKPPAASVGQKDGADLTSSHARAHAVRSHDEPPEMSIVTPVTVRQTDANIEDTVKKVDTPLTAQKVTEPKPDDKSTPITIRRAIAERDHSKSPSKSLQGSSSSITKLKPDVPEFVPRSMRNSEASACSRAHTPPPNSGEGSRPSSPSKFTAHAPEFIPRHMRTSTDASASSGTPQSPTIGRPASPLKLHEMSAESPILAAVRVGSPKPQFNSSINISDKEKGSESHCMKHDKHVLGPSADDTTKPPISTRKTATAPPLSKTHLNRVSRREMAKSEPTSHASQMSDSQDGAVDSGSGEGQGSSTETTVMMVAPKTMSPMRRRVTAPSDPPSVSESPKRGLGMRAGDKVARSKRHWRLKRSARSGMTSTAGMASESSMGESSGDGSLDGGVPKAPAASPNVGPVKGEAFMSTE